MQIKNCFSEKLELIIFTKYSKLMHVSADSKDIFWVEYVLR